MPETQTPPKAAKKEQVVLSREESLKTMLTLNAKAKKEPAWKSYEVTIMNNKGAIHKAPLRIAFNLVRYDGAQVVKG